MADTASCIIDALRALRGCDRHSASITARINAIVTHCKVCTTSYVSFDAWVAWLHTLRERRGDGGAESV